MIRRRGRNGGGPGTNMVSLRQIGAAGLRTCQFGGNPSLLDTEQQVEPASEPARVTRMYMYLAQLAKLGNREWLRHHTTPRAARASCSCMEAERQRVFWARQVPQ
ncbi:hypothetical protein F442_03202 [Phytophthora nicotianae P10297]|uniref:Uncharacterized protein n=1 Tax=Phytophthora nicotianae P10297 TaxID=1317064 RepID=W2ZZM7_PHYNI|nr:hypothetical protein F442_03202 [Phytophthora nicotianae P10297]